MCQLSTERHLSLSGRRLALAAPPSVGRLKKRWSPYHATGPHRDSLRSSPGIHTEGSQSFLYLCWKRSSDLASRWCPAAGPSVAGPPKMSPSQSRPLIVSGPQSRPDEVVMSELVFLI